MELSKSTSVKGKRSGTAESITNTTKKSRKNNAHRHWTTEEIDLVLSFMRDTVTGNSELEVSQFCVYVFKYLNICI